MPSFYRNDRHTCAVCRGFRTLIGEPCPNCGGTGYEPEGGAEDAPGVTNDTLPNLGDPFPAEKP